jgi:hypothetical protein
MREGKTEGAFKRGSWSSIPVFVVVVGEDGEVKDLFTGTEDDIVAFASLKQMSSRPRGDGAVESEETE